MEIKWHLLFVGTLELVYTMISDVGISTSRSFDLFVKKSKWNSTSYEVIKIREGGFLAFWLLGFLAFRVPIVCPGLNFGYVFVCNWNTKVVTKGNRFPCSGHPSFDNEQFNNSIE
jgi:hypothetical protein